MSNSGKLQSILGIPATLDIDCLVITTMYDPFSSIGILGYFFLIAYNVI